MKKLFKLAVLAAIGFGLYKAVAKQRAQWEGLTESEVRSRLDSKLAGKVPPEKAQMIGDTVVGQMRARGVLADEPVMNGAGEPETITT